MATLNSAAVASSTEPAYPLVVDVADRHDVLVLHALHRGAAVGTPATLALLMEQRQGYEQAISGMRQRMGSITPTGGTVPEGAPAAPKVEGRVPQNAPLVTGGGNPPPVTVPPAILQDAQRAIAAGAPRAAVIKRLQDQGYPTDGL